MASFQEIIIQHLELQQINDYKFSNKHNFIVFWWNEIPLGHLWLIVENQISPGEIRNQVITSITPAIAYYCKECGADDESWKTHLQNGDIDALSAFLTSYIKSPELTTCHMVSENKVTVIICTRNRSQSLKNCIESLLNSSDQDFELIVVDNAPDDKSTKDIVNRFPSVRYIREERKGLDIARNTGTLHASHNIVAYTDDDVLVSKNWIETLKSCFQDPFVSCVTGQVFPCSLSTEAQYIFEKYWGFNKGYIPLLYDQQYFNRHCKEGVPVWETGAGANMAFRKEIFDRVGLFDERLDVGAAGCSGDSELWYRILAGGWNCRYYPHLFVYHNHRETKKELQKQLYNYMRGYVAALLVQYEKFHHKGNLIRLYKTTPKWYLHRFKRALRGRKEGFLFFEIKGYLSGWRFYQSNKKPNLKRGK
ncbi:MAG: glycosyltransferase [Segetibacter sp.]